MLAYVNQHNRPFNSTNVGDGLAKQGVKKALAERYLTQLAESGKISVKEAGKQKVYFALQPETDPAGAENLKRQENHLAEMTRTLAEERSGLDATTRALRDAESAMSVKDMKAKTVAMQADIAALEATLVPLRAKKTPVVSEAQRTALENAFLKSMELWSTRRRQFRDAYDGILEATGGNSKSFSDELGLELDPVANKGKSVAGSFDEYKETFESLKKKKATDARVAKRQKL